MHVKRVKSLSDKIRDSKSQISQVESETKPKNRNRIIYMQILKEEKAAQSRTALAFLWQSAENLIGDSFLPIWRFSSRPIRPSVLHCRYCHDCYNAKLVSQHGAQRKMELCHSILNIILILIQLINLPRTTTSFSS